mmetsp:Transcript_57547/g.129736  ORF Transcript_57547/g.129736 Transcript_57547/m.129736 type:complete len:338 (+) Transcript_57547:33-1046(+)
MARLTQLPGCTRGWDPGLCLISLDLKAGRLAGWHATSSDGALWQVVVHLVRLPRRVHGEVEALLLEVVRCDQEAGKLQDGKENTAQAAGPASNAGDLSDVCPNQVLADPVCVAITSECYWILEAPETVGTMEIVNSLAPVEEGCSKDTPCTTRTVHGERIYDVVNFGRPENRRRSLEDDGANEGGQESGAALHVGTASGDGNEASKDTIAEAGHIEPPDQGITEGEDEETTSRSSYCGVHCHLRCEHPSLDGVHAQRGAAVEAIPPEPQDECAQDNQRQAVGVESLWDRHNPVLCRLIQESVLPWAGNKRAHKGPDATSHVDDATPCKVIEAPRVHG